jgi:cytochrome c2
MRRLLLAGLATTIGVAAALVVALAVFGDETKPVVDVPGGSAERGRHLIEYYGCGSCHTISGVHSTSKYIGPPLNDFAERRFIAGKFPNTLAELMRWIEDPQALDPGNVMPTLGVKPQEARDIAAFLYSDH